MKRPSKALWAILYAAAFAAAIITAAQPADAAQPTPQERERFLRVYGMTASCMGTAARSLLIYGERNRAEIETFMVRACGPQLNAQLVMHEGMTQEDASAALRFLAHQTLNQQLN